MNCNACQALCQLILDGNAPAEQVDLDQHLRDCADCRAYHHTALRLQAGLRRLRPPSVPTDLAARVVATIQADRLRTRRKRLRMTLGLAAAASVLVAVSAWLIRPYFAPAPPPDNKNENYVQPITQPPREASLSPRQSVEKVVETVASLTTEKTAETVAQTKQLLPLVGPVLPDWSQQPIVTEPKLPFREAGHGVVSAVEPVADHAKRFMGMVRRDFLPDVTAKPGL